MGDVTTVDLDRMLDAVREAKTDAERESALQALREANGIYTAGVTTELAVRVLKRRRAQGFSMREISWMVGLSRGQCFDIQSGRRKVARGLPQARNALATTLTARTGADRDDGRYVAA